MDRETLKFQFENLFLDDEPKFPENVLNYVNSALDRVRQLIKLYKKRLKRGGFGGGSYNGGSGGHWTTPSRPFSFTRFFNNTSKEAAKGGMKALGLLGEAINTVAIEANPIVTPLVNILPEKLKKAVKDLLYKTLNKAFTYLSPVNHVAAWTLGTVDPEVGAEAVSKLDPRFLFPLRLGEMYLMGKIGKGTGRVGSKVKLTFNAAPHQLNISSPTIVKPFEPLTLLGPREYVSPVTRRVSFNTSEPIMTNKSVSAKITKNVPTEEPVYIEESVPVKEPITINIRNLIRDADKERWGDNYKRVNLEELLKVAKQRIGRELTDQELNQFIGEHSLYAFPEFRHRSRSNIHEPLLKTGDAIIELYDNPEIIINKLVDNFNKLTDKNTIRTKIGQGRYSESDFLSMLNEDGTFKDNVMLLETYPGKHGVDNWYDSGVDLNENIRRWFNTKYNTGSQQSIMKENPIKDSSGLVIKGKSGDFSIDSFFAALKFLRMALNPRGAGRNFFKLNKQSYEPDYIGANDLGLKFRYEEIDFDPEFSELVKKTLKDQEIEAKQNNTINEGKLPEGTEIGRINSPGNKNHGNIIIRYNGKKVGMLRPRTAKEIAGYGEGKNRVPGIYDKLIDELNNTYGLDIKYPQGDDYGMIQWPNIRGILYKKGGNINVFPKNIPAHRKKLKITCGLS